MKRRTSNACLLVLCAFLLGLVPACKAVPYDAHVRAIVDALDGWANDTPDGFFYAALDGDTLAQLRSQAEQATPGAWVYRVDACLPTIDVDAARHLVARDAPTIAWEAATEQMAQDARAAFEREVCAAMLPAMRSGAIPVGDPFAFEVTVVPDGDAFAATIANIDDARAYIASALRPAIERALLDDDLYAHTKAAQLARESIHNGRGIFAQTHLAQRTQIRSIAREDTSTFRVSVAYPDIGVACLQAGAIFLDAMEKPIKVELTSYLYATEYDRLLDDELDACTAMLEDAFIVDIAQPTKGTFGAFEASVREVVNAFRKKTAELANAQYLLTPSHGVHYDEARFAENFGAKLTDFEPPMPMDRVVVVVRKDVSGEWEAVDEQIRSLFAARTPPLYHTDNARFASIAILYDVRYPFAGEYGASDRSSVNVYNCELTLTAYDLRAHKRLAQATFGSYYGKSVRYADTWLEEDADGEPSLFAFVPTLSLEKHDRYYDRLNAFFEKIEAACEPA